MCYYALQGGVRGASPRKILEFRSSEIDSDTI